MRRSIRARGHAATQPDIGPASAGHPVSGTSTRFRFDYYRDAARIMSFSKRSVRRARRPIPDAQTVYDFPAMRRPRRQRDVRSGLPKPSSFFVFNSAVRFFSAPRARGGALLFDSNGPKNLFFDLIEGKHFPELGIVVFGRMAEAPSGTAVPCPAAVRPTDGGTCSPPFSDGSGATVRFSASARAGLPPPVTIARTDLVERATGKPFALRSDRNPKRGCGRSAPGPVCSTSTAGLRPSPHLGVSIETRRIIFDFDIIHNRLITRVAATIRRFTVARRRRRDRHP